MCKIPFPRMCSSPQTLQLHIIRLPTAVRSTDSPIRHIPLVLRLRRLSSAPTARMNSQPYSTGPGETSREGAEAPRNDRVRPLWRQGPRPMALTCKLNQETPITPATLRSYTPVDRLRRPCGRASALPSMMTHLGKCVIMLGLSYGPGQHLQTSIEVVIGPTNVCH